MPTNPDNRLLTRDSPRPEPIGPVVAAFDVLASPLRAECLEGAGGFSGARLWRFSTRQGDYCLRRWPPEHPSPERLDWIHSVLRHAAAKGFRCLPVPVATRGGATWLHHQGHLWELVPWLPGTADFARHPSTARLAAALRALAEFHRSVEDFAPQPPAPSAGIAERLKQLERLLEGGFRDLAAAVAARSVAPLDAAAARWIELCGRLGEPIRCSLAQAADLRLRRQPCIRDVWHDHVLYEGDVVTGLVDFGAMRVESVSGDIARLTGSLVGSDANSWRTALDAYEAIRPLDDRERQLLGVFDVSGLLLGGANWIDWIYRQGREFRDFEAVRSRLDAIVVRLEGVR
ncbi:MAG: phosphotransferase [Planctomycetaceae bacterium]|nr:phosphotransferase [Planctomycetaceae bacterium]